MVKKKNQTENGNPNLKLRKGTEEIMGESEERYRTLIDEIDEGYYEVDLAGNFTFVNDSMIRQLQYSREELIGMNYRIYIPREEVEGVYKAFNRVYRTGEIIKWYPVTNIRKDGRPIFAEDSISCRRDKEGRVIGFRGISRDITERKLAEETLRESENRYRDLVENSQDLICTHDLEGNLLSVNEAPVRALGYSREVLFHANMRDLLAPEQRDKFGAYLKEIKEKGRASGILQIKTSSGEIRYWEYNNTLRTEGVAVPIVRGIAHDVTERRTAELALRMSEERYRLHFENVSDVIFSLIGISGLTSISPSLERILGYKPEEFVGKSFVELNILPPESLEQVLSDVQRVFAGERLDSTIYKLMARDGTIKYGEFSSTPLFREGQVVAVVSVGRDITERRQTENALRASEEWFRKIFEEAHQVGIVITSPLFVFEKANPAFCRMMGYSADELRSMSFVNITHPDYLKQDMENVKKVGRGEIPFYQTEKKYINKSGKVLWGNLIVSSIRDEHDALQYYLSMVIDITEQKRVEETLRESQQIIEGIINAIPVRVFWKDKNLVYLGCNSEFARDAGFVDPKDIIGKDDYQMGWRDQAELYRSDDHEVIENGCSKFLIEEPQTTPEGNAITLLTSKIPLRTSNGEIYRHARDVYGHHRAQAGRRKTQPDPGEPS